MRIVRVPSTANECTLNFCIRRTVMSVTWIWHDVTFWRKHVAPQLEAVRAPWTPLRIPGIAKIILRGKIIVSDKILTIIKNILQYLNRYIFLEFLCCAVLWHGSAITLPHLYSGRMILSTCSTVPTVGLLTISGTACKTTENFALVVKTSPIYTYCPLFAQCIQVWHKYSPVVCGDLNLESNFPLTNTADPETTQTFFRNKSGITVKRLFCRQFGHSSTTLYVSLVLSVVLHEKLQCVYKLVTCWPFFVGSF